MSLQQPLLLLLLLLLLLQPRLSPLLLLPSLPPLLLLWNYCCRRRCRPQLVDRPSFESSCNCCEARCCSAYTGRWFTARVEFTNRRQHLAPPQRSAAQRSAAQRSAAPESAWTVRTPLAP